jgi:signal transduction histidine kinase
MIGRRAPGRLEAVTEVVQAILAGEAADLVLERIAHLARDLAGAALATIALPEPDGGSLTIHVAEGADAASLLGMDLPASGRTLTSRHGAAVADLSSEAGEFRHFAAAADMGPAVFVPMVGHADNLGTLMLANPRGAPPFTESEIGVLGLFATAAAVAVEYGRAHQRLERRMLAEDRERVAGELRYGIIQALFALGMRLQHSADMTGEPNARSQLQADVAALDGVIRDLRGHVFSPRPGAPREAALDGRLRQLVRQFEMESGVGTALDVETAAIAAISERSAEVVQVVAEALSNVREHALAVRCTVSLLLAGEPAAVVLRVEDDGRGFDPSITGGRHGLRHLHERAARLGGELTIVSPGDGGSAIVLTIPVSIPSGTGAP